MERTKRGIGAAGALILAATLLSGCGTFFKVRVASPREWLEGKDYVVQFSMAKAEKATKITLYYRVNNGPIQVVEPALKGSLREHLIPASQLAPGRLDYYLVIVDDKGKEHRDGEVSVIILSRAEGKAQAERDLMRRVKVAAPAEIAIIDDLEVSVRVLSPLDGTTVAAMVRHASESGYAKAALTPVAGEYRFKIPAGDLEQGAFSYYFTLEERHPDFGLIGVTYPQDGADRPLVVKVLGLGEMAERMESDLVRGTSHVPPREAPVTEDLRVTLSLSSPRGTMLEDLIQGAPSVSLRFGRKDSRAPFRSLPMERGPKGDYAAVIDRRSIADGTDSYYFVIRAQARAVGELEAALPEAEGSYFSYRIVSLSELRMRRAADYAPRLAHVAPTDASIDRPLRLALTVKDAPEAMKGSVYFKKASEKTFRVAPMRATAEGLSAVIAREDLGAGQMVYYFTASLFFPDVGEVALTFPPEGQMKPLSLDVEDPEIARRALRDDLFRRSTHLQPPEAIEESGVTLTLSVRDMKPGTKAVLYVKRSRDAAYAPRPMVNSGGDLVTDLSPTDLKARLDSYYMEVVEPDARFGSVSAIVPLDGRANPYRLLVRKRGEAPAASPTGPAAPPAASPPPKDKPDGPEASRPPRDKPDGPAASRPPRDKPDGPAASRPPEDKPGSPIGKGPGRKDDKDKDKKNAFGEVIAIDRVSDPKPGKPFEVRVRVKDAPAGLKIDLAYRVSGDKEFKIASMAARGVNWIGLMDPAALKPGARIDYWLIVRNPAWETEMTYPDEEIGPFFFMVPEDGAAKPGEGKGR